MKIWGHNRHTWRSHWVGGALSVLVIASVAWAPDVGAQTGDDLKVMLDRLQRLERDIRTMNVQISRGGTAPVPATGAKPQPAPAASVAPREQPTRNGPALIRLGVRLTALEEDLRVVTGSMEEFGFQVGEILKRLDKLVADVDYRLSALENRVSGAPGARARTLGQAPLAPRLSAAPQPLPVQKVIPGQGVGFAAPRGNLGTVSQKAVSSVQPPPPGNEVKPAVSEAASRAPPATAVPAPPPQPAVQASRDVAGVLPEGTVKEQYAYAFGLLRKANYERAEQALQEFVRLHPKESLASNARYWLGETYYVRAAYVQAAEIFLAGYQADPKGPKAPDSLLKLGMSLAGLDKNREACAAFEKLTRDFPDAAGVKNTVNREKQKNGCS